VSDQHTPPPAIQRPRLTVPDSVTETKPSAAPVQFQLRVVRASRKWLCTTGPAAITQCSQKLMLCFRRCSWAYSGSKRRACCLWPIRPCWKTRSNAGPHQKTRSGSRFGLTHRLNGPSFAHIPLMDASVCGVSSQSSVHVHTQQVGSTTTSASTPSIDPRKLTSLERCVSDHPVVRFLPGLVARCQTHFYSCTAHCSCHGAAYRVSAANQTEVDDFPINGIVAKVTALPWYPLGRLASLSVEEHERPGSSAILHLKEILDDSKVRLEKFFASIRTARERSFSRMSDEDIMEHMLKKCQCLICTDRSEETPNPGLHHYCDTHTCDTHTHTHHDIYLRALSMSL